MERRISVGKYSDLNKWTNSISDPDYSGKKKWTDLSIWPVPESVLESTPGAQIFSALGRELDTRFVGIFNL